MIDTLIYGSAGVGLGIMAGILPGLGTGSVMALMSLLLMGSEPQHVLIFYLGILVSAQYFGSVTAILTGIPGDPSSLPSATWGFPAAQQGQGQELLYITAKWSLISGITGFVLCVMIIVSGTYWARSLSVSVQSWLLLGAIVSIMLFSANTRIKNMILLCLGGVLASVGYSENFMQYFWVDSSSWLSDGIPWLPIMMGLMVIPGVMSLLSYRSQLITVTQRPRSLESHWPSGVRGGLIGFVLGTVPGMSYVLGSLVASKVEYAIQANAKKVVVASESANNAGATSMLLPLIMLGIPITTSDSVVYALLTANQSHNTISTIFHQHWPMLVIYFVVINLMLFLLAWRTGAAICGWVFEHAHAMAIMAMTLSVLSTSWLGYHTGQLSVSLAALAISTLVGLRFRDHDFSPVVYMMIMYPFVELTWHKASQLYF